MGEELQGRSLSAGDRSSTHRGKRKGARGRLFRLMARTPAQGVPFQSISSQTDDRFAVRNRDTAATWSFSPFHRNGEKLSHCDQSDALVNGVARMRVPLA